MVDTGRVISTAIQFIDGFTNPSRQVIDQMKKMGGEAVKAGNQIKRAGKTIAGAGSALTKSVTMPIAGVATAAIKTAADFESSMSQVAATMGKTKEDIGGLTELAQTMGSTTAFSASEAAEGINILAMAGLQEKEICESLGTVLDLAAAGAMDMGSSASYIVGAVKGFGDEMKNASTYADLMAKGATLANTDVAALGEAVSYSAATAAGYSQSADSMTLSLLRMAEQNVTGQTAATSLNRAMADLYSPTAEAKRALDNLGISAYNTDGSARDFNIVVDELSGALKGMSEENANALKSTIFTTNGMNAFNKMTASTSGRVKELQKGLGEAGGSAAQQAKTQLDNLNGQITLLKSAVEGIAISVGDKLLPHIKKAVEWFQSAAEHISNLSDAQVDNILKWAGIAAAIGPALMIFGKVVTAVGSVKRAFGAVRRTIGTFGGVIGTITSPAGIVIGVLAAIALAAALIIKNWDQVKGFLSNVGSWFKGAFDAAGVSVEDFKNVFSSIGETAGKIADTIGGFVGGISEMFRKKFGPYVSEGAKAAGKGMQDGAAEVIGGTFAVAQAAEDGIQTFAALLDFFGGAFRGDWDNAARGFRDSVKTIFPPDTAGKFLAAFDGFLPGIEGIVEGVKKALEGCAQDAKKIFGNFKDVFKGAGEFLSGIFSGDVDQALGGFKKAAESGLDAAGNIFRAKIGVIKNFVTGALSKFLPESAVSAIEGVFDMVASRWDVAIGAAKGCVDGFVDAVKPLLENVKTVFEGLGQFVQGAFAGDWKGALEGLKKATGGALDGMANIVKAPFKMIGGAVKGAIENFKGFNAAKGIFGSLKGAVGNAFRSCGVDTEKFGKKMSGMKEKAESIMGGLKTIFGAVKDAAGKAFGFIGDVIQKAMAVAVPAVKVAFSAIGGAVAAAAHNISSVIDGLLTVIDGIVTFVSGVFTGNWKQAWEGVKDIFGGIFETFAALCKTPINAVIGIINGAINGINSINVTIPEWVPGVGGQAFGINIPTIPMLYRGTDNWKGGMAMIHDRGGEIVDLPRGSRVYPHDKSVEMARKEGERQGPGSVTVNIQKLADRIEVRSEEDIDRIAEALAYKLKKVAFNTGAA